MPHKRMDALMADSKVQRPGPAPVPALVLEPGQVLVPALVAGPRQHKQVAVEAMPSLLAGGSAWPQRWQTAVGAAHLLAHHGLEVWVCRTEMLRM